VVNQLFNISINLTSHRNREGPADIARGMPRSKDCIKNSSSGLTARNQQGDQRTWETSWLMLSGGMLSSWHSQDHGCAGHLLD